MGKSQNFVFEYDEEDEDLEPLTPFEQRMASQAVDGAVDQSGGDRQDPLASETVDVLSAYSPEQGFVEVSVEELHALRGNAANAPILLDVRTEEEFGNGRASGALNIPLDALTDAVKGGRLPAKDAAIAVICQSGRRSAQAAVKLTRVHGYTDVVNVKGGTLAWMAAGLPTE